MHERLSRVRAFVFQTLASMKARLTGGVNLLFFGLALVLLLMLGIGIALAVYSGSSETNGSSSVRSDVPRDVVRPVRLQDFRFPRVHLMGPEEDFFRYRDPDSPWSEEEVEQVWLDLEEEAADIVRDENRELLNELLNMQP